jgi:hypothetical protein
VAQAEQVLVVRLQFIRLVAQVAQADLVAAVAVLVATELLSEQAATVAAVASLFTTKIEGKL